ncbi:MAG: DUF3298 and DUF4163 domain-containing protein, partial [Clostridiales bacterium]|nr:DUF3298 and DUF4163 domain-containing protein [Clostridiales bacterium]
MRKSILSIVLIISLAAFCLVGCGDGSSSKLKIKTEEITKSEDFLEIDMKIPSLSGFPGAEELNNAIDEKVRASIKEVEDAAAELERMNREGFKASLNANYQYFHNGDIVSLWIYMDNYTGGAHGMYWLDSYTFNVATGELYSFKDLFKEDSNGFDQIVAKIMKEVEDDDIYFDTAKDTVASYEGNFNFLINGDELVVYFPLYDIAPYVAGIRSFTFELEHL